VEANSTGGQGSRRAVAPSGDDDDDDDDDEAAAVCVQEVTDFTASCITGYQTEVSNLRISKRMPNSTSE
jgi:hypothetical protein